MAAVRMTDSESRLHMGELHAPQGSFFELWSGVVAGLTLCSYVGNTMAVLVMQTLGCEVAALNTVHFSMSISFIVP